MVNAIPRTGYHYTSYENWLHIKEQGLIPYNLDYKLIDSMDIPGIKGIFVFEKQLEGISHVGTLIFQLTSKNTTKLVELCVTYKYVYDFFTKEVYECRQKGTLISLPHSGTIGKFTYHEKEYLNIISRTVPTEDIKLVSVYDLKEACHRQLVVREDVELLATSI